MLIGRDAEKARLELLLREARAGRGSALVLLGEAGIGKTVLLDWAAEQADGFLVLRALGVESEAELAFAALHELSRPILARVDELPRPQANALETALALVYGGEVDRFSAYAATLGLLAAAAAEEPLLCVIDDAHWLDQASAEALLFAARRIADEAIMILFAAREPAPSPFVAPGIAALRLGGLQPGEARTLVAAAAPGLMPAAAEQVVGIANGNPLALSEFAVALAGTETGEDSDKPLPVGASVQWAFLVRLSRLSGEARRAVLLLATGDPTEPDAIWAALETAGLPPRAVSEAQREGLLAPGRRLDFCHPLARSAIYQTSAPADLRAAHAIFAETTSWPDRRAWHLAAAATGPDEEVASALEEAASAAGARGGVSAEAQALERGARLTPDPEKRARRLFRAGLAAEAAGRLEHAERLLAEAAETTADGELRADAVTRRSYLLFDRGERALALATAEAEQAAPLTAARILAASGLVHAFVHRLDVPAALATAARAAELAGDRFREDLDLCHMLAWTWELSGRTQDSLALVRECASGVAPGTILAIDFALRFLYLEEHGRARELLDGIVAHEREAGALGNLAYAVDNLAHLDLRTGRLTAAYTGCLECVQLTEPLGNDVALAATLARLALVEAMLGRSGDACAHAGRALEIASARGDDYNAVRARAAFGLEALARGDVNSAVEWLEPAEQMLEAGGVHHPNLFRIHADLVESQVRAGRRDDAERILARLVHDAEVTRSAWAESAAGRCRALLADDADTHEAFGVALELQERGPDEFERARTELCYGERLRRLRHRRDARQHLHAAFEAFERLGARPWAERARAELRASGERLRPRGLAAPEQLTPQELQVALAASEGLTNKEIGARLFLSPKTVEFHLTRAYRKLDVRSRAELTRLLTAEPGAVERLTARQ
jgi:DNA-binding CsgD family transcriptional regulator